MSVACTGLFAAKWTTRIEDEWTRNLEAKTGRPRGSFLGRRDAMREAIPDWEVAETAWSILTSHLALPDVNDVHVLAAAIAGHADCIVTANLKEFPDRVLAPFGLQAIHPDAFLVAQMDLDLFPVLKAFKEMRARWKNPANTPMAFTEALERNSLVQTAQRLRIAADLI